MPRFTQERGTNHWSFNMLLRFSRSPLHAWLEWSKGAATHLFPRRRKYLSVNHLSDSALSDIGLTREEIDGAADRYFKYRAEGGG